MWVPISVDFKGSKSVPGVWRAGDGGEDLREADPLPAKAWIFDGWPA
jgi:hypothetical protein